jgi:aerobic C4-dicarboxylate transport protein
MIGTSSVDSKLKSSFELSHYMKRILSNLTTWVLLAIFCGALLGLFAPSYAVKMQPLGTYFVDVVKVFIYPIILLTISLGISSMGSLKQVGRVGGKAILYFEIITTLALLIGVGVAWVIQPGAGLVMTATPSEEVANYTSAATDFSFWNFFKTNLTLQVVLFAILLGIVLNKYNSSKGLRSKMEVALNYVFKGLHLVMLFAPLGAFGGIAFTIGKFGVASLIPLAKLMITVYCTMALFIFGILGAVLQYYKISIFQFLKYIKEELLIVLGTSSSESALPLLMEKLEKMGCSKSVVGLVVPAGYSFNLDGTTLYLSMAVLFLAQVYAVDLSWMQIATLIGVLMITSKGAAGVTGSGFIVLASTLAAVKVIPLEGLALLLGVDRFMSEARSITNIIGNGVATLFLANNEKEFDRSKMEAAFSKEDYEYESES